MNIIMIYSSMGHQSHHSIIQQIKNKYFIAKKSVVQYSNILEIVTAIFKYIAVTIFFVSCVASILI